MRSFLLMAALSTLLSGAAYADTIDDFVLTGQGHTITFSAPGSTVIMDHPHIVSLGDTVSATIDGVPGFAELATFFLPFLNPPSMTLTTPASIDGGQLQLYGEYLLNFTIVPIANPTPFYPDNIAITFLQGTHLLTEESLGGPPAAYVLTITQEAPTAAAPEPFSLILVSTGAASVLGLAGRRRDRQA